MEDTAEIGEKKALEEAGLLRPYIKLREAHRMYGEPIVKRWIREGLVKTIKDGDRTASVRIDRIQIEAVAKASNRSFYLTTAERQ